jgi:hypothetical protein
MDGYQFSTAIVQSLVSLIATKSVTCWRALVQIIQYVISNRYECFKVSLTFLTGVGLDA